MTPDATMMHGSDYAGQDPRGWTVTEKLDGHFARWTGERLLTREGVDYRAPAWFTAGLPAFPLDCELFAGYGKRQTLNGASRWKDAARWRGLELVVFDAPTLAGGYPQRHGGIVAQVASRPGLRVVWRWTCPGRPGLADALDTVCSRGGEGLVIRKPEAPYTVGRVQTMLKVKPGFIL